MAHDKCIGTFEHSKLGGSMDGSNGKFKIDQHNGGNVPITGKHLGRGNAPLSGNCDGSVISFTLTDPQTHCVISYMNGSLSSSGGKDLIKGKFSNSCFTLAKPAPKKAITAPDDWEADKTT